ncbi:MAG: PIN domain-containing protein [Candidatus Beckwithbacteria bacterium]|nr:PIN domain-containing protein [Patescibacteria group bacterium]
MKRVLVDTNILIDFSKGKGELLEKYLLGKDKWELWVNPVVVAEFLNDKWLTTKVKQKKAEEFIDLFKCVDINKKEGIKTGELIRSGQIDYLGDGMIASSCLINKILLLTRNKKHFCRVKGLRLL